MSSAAPVAPIEEKPLSEVERIVDTFVAPSKTLPTCGAVPTGWRHGC